MPCSSPSPIWYHPDFLVLIFSLRLASPEISLSLALFFFFLSPAAGRFDDVSVLRRHYDRCSRSIRLAGRQSCLAANSMLMIITHTSFCRSLACNLKTLDVALRLRIDNLRHRGSRICRRASRNRHVECLYCPIYGLWIVYSRGVWVAQRVGDEFRRDEICFYMIPCYHPCGKENIDE